MSESVACEVCHVEVVEEEAEEFLGCDDDALLMCRDCANEAWKIPEMFAGGIGLRKTNAVSMVRSHRGCPT